MIERVLKNIDREITAMTSGQAPSKEQIAGFTQTIEVQNLAPNYFTAQLTLTFADGVKWTNFSMREYMGIANLVQTGNSLQVNIVDMIARQEPYEITAVSLAPFVMVQSG